MVKTLSQTNTANFNVQLGRLDAALDQIGSFRAEVGARVNASQSTKDSLEQLSIHTASLRRLTRHLSNHQRA
jgi:flagellin-like hook-associated protein FlgL